MATEEFLHSDSYKSFVNSVLQNIKDRSVQDPVWGPKIPGNYEELKQHSLQFIDKYSAPPSVQPSPLLPSPSFESNLQISLEETLEDFRTRMFAESRLRRFRDLCHRFLQDSEFNRESVQGAFEIAQDEFHQETEPYMGISEEELEGMKMTQAVEHNEHRLFVAALGEKIGALPYAEAREMSQSLTSLLVRNHQQSSRGFIPPIAETNEDEDLGRLAGSFGIEEEALTEVLYAVNKFFISSTEKAVTWNVLNINEQISDPGASSVQFKLFVALAEVSLECGVVECFMAHRQRHFVRGFLDSFQGKNDEILVGEEAFLHIANAQVVHQKICPPNITQKQSGLTKLRYLRTQSLRQSVMSIVNWMISTLKSLDRESKEIEDEGILEKTRVLEERDLVLESKEFPNCVVVRDPVSSHNLLFVETHQVMEEIRSDLLSFGSHFIRKFEQEMGPEIDRKAMVEDLYECECAFEEAKRKLVVRLLQILDSVYTPTDLKELQTLVRGVIFSRPVVALDSYDYFRIPFEINTQIFELMTEALSTEVVKSVEDVKVVFGAVQNAVNTFCLKTGILTIEGLVNGELLIWSEAASLLREVKEGDLRMLFASKISKRVQSILNPGAPKDETQVGYFGTLDGVRFEVVRSLVFWEAYKSQCESKGVEMKEHLDRTLFSELTGEPDEEFAEFELGVDEVKAGHVGFLMEQLELLSRTQRLESQLFEAIVGYNFISLSLEGCIEGLGDSDLDDPALNKETLKSHLGMMEGLENDSFQTVEKLKANIRESLQVLNLNAGSHFDELISAHQKQTGAVVQFLQNRVRLPDVVRVLHLFDGGIPDALESLKMVELVQPSMRREKARALHEFYSLALSFCFLSFHEGNLGLPQGKIFRRLRKMKFVSPLLQSLLEETNQLQSESQKSLTAKNLSIDLLLRLEISALQTGLDVGKNQTNAKTPGLLDLTGDWVIRSDKIDIGDMNVIETIESQILELRQMGMSVANLLFQFCWQFPDSMRSRIKREFDATAASGLGQTYRSLRQKLLLIRMIGSPTLKIGEFPSPFGHLMFLLEGILDGSDEGLRFVLLHVMIQRCLRRPGKEEEPKKRTIEGPVTEKTPFLADIDSLPKETKSEYLHPALAQFLEQLQLKSSSEKRGEIKISQFDVNQSLLKLAQSLSELFDSSLVQTHKAFLELYTRLYDANRTHEEDFRRRIQAINREARTFNRRLQTALADRAHSVGYEISLLQETLKSSKFDREERQAVIRRELREEYAPQVRDLTLKLFSLRHNLEQYQKNLQNEIEGAMFEIKKQSISQLLRSQNLPDEVKDSMRQAFDFDDKLHELMETRGELSSAVFKLRAMRLLQDFSVRSDFQVKLKQIEEQREAVKQENAEFVRERDVKEAALKQQYSSVMQSVRSAEREAERLRRELELENKNRAKLREWRTKHEKRVAGLEKKLARLTEWSKYEPDRLLFELDKTQTEIDRLKRSKERAPEILERTKAAVDRELKRAKQQLRAQKAANESLERVANTTMARQTMASTSEVQSEDLVAVMEENSRLKEENEQLQQRLAELSLQMASVSEIRVGGLKLKASRRDGLS